VEERERERNRAMESVCAATDDMMVERERKVETRLALEFARKETERADRETEREEEWERKSTQQKLRERERETEQEQEPEKEMARERVREGQRREVTEKHLLEMRLVEQQSERNAREFEFAVAHARVCTNLFVVDLFCWSRGPYVCVMSNMNESYYI